ncbi:Na+/H+ antiporter [Rhizosaccharibacter radicis]|uniref:Na+/H+ antiporter n=1 Tax=Rhizosaccharibacter radicis TaxID=2782605 RepID=A0ABT1VYK8_9PROT|nr:Na+/H+ antiporter [Acetobacteraceae bacterium KSS12]
MSAVARFETVLLLVAAIVVLRQVAGVLRMQPASALILGGCVLAFVPGMPRIQLDPDLILVLFLPPLLTASAYYASWAEFRRNVGGILLLAVGAVGFTTLCVGLVAHLAVPGLPWAACFALGAVVSPPDAVAAKAVLERVALPRRLVALLEGESLLNDAAGIVLFRFAVAAALTGTFDAGRAGATFVLLAVVGVAVGVGVALLLLPLLRRIRDREIVVLMTLMLPWVGYIGAERLGGSGVIAAVCSGLVLGWFQHESIRAEHRRAATAVWRLVVMLLEALVFVLIGLSLRAVFDALPDAAIGRLVVPTLLVVLAVILSRFAWVMGSHVLRPILSRVLRREALPGSLAEATVLGWAGMRGVVTLAVALSVPEAMPGRDLILVAAFAVILVTVLFQGSTLGALIGLLGVRRGAEETYLSLQEAGAQMAAAQLRAVEANAYDADGALQHPRLLEQYRYMVRIRGEFSARRDAMLAGRNAHYEVVLAAVAAGREEVVRLHRAGRIHDEVLHALETELDIQQINSERALTL